MTRIRTVLLGLVVAFAASFAVAAPAHAVSYDNVCDNGEVCLFENQYYGGGKADFHNQIHNYTTYTFFGGCDCLVNDRVSSLRNYDLSYTVDAYTDKWGFGDWLGTPAWGDRPQLSATFNDKFSSHYWHS
ncbi:peptidase inhibitor family I36 protein [Catellatospora coxensis]|uniref:Peptidase inhibitor family I36 n=1 Tax=Catellatospora coxensis TaxID=310354 RepID=A0A8J3KTH6_9ACTN|nr:peptidase inhibitor family I36 protein [Catellatospora coxensis]GIG08787.1 hypothetical protein Cco03nite_54870 [Catellatospora coxensis]